MKNKKRVVFSNNKILFLLFACLLVLANLLPFTQTAKAMPFYDLQPQKIVKRAEFYTTYSSSSPERKTNIALAVKAINNAFIDVGAEFSFNDVVGERTEKKGYKISKIILDGNFVDGIGGGVCQVSSTLYNAVLLSGLRVIEYHPHSLPVSYVAPSFDAMVSWKGADLRFVNDTKNPVILKGEANGERVKFTVYGEPMREKIIRQSTIKEYLEPLSPEIIKDEKGDYPDLLLGQSMVLKYAKQGYVSEGRLIKTVNGKVTENSLLRKDKYRAQRGLIIEGTAKEPQLREDNQI